MINQICIKLTFNVIRNLNSSYLLYILFENIYVHIKLYNIYREIGLKINKSSVILCSVMENI